MSAPAYELFPDLIAEAPVPPRGIHSQTISEGDGVELVLFAFAEGEELKEHTSARPTIIHVLSGEADLTVGGEAPSARRRLGSGWPPICGTVSLRGRHW